MDDTTDSWIVADSNGLCITGCYPTHRFLFRESEGDCWDPYDEENAVVPDDCHHEWWDRGEAKVFISLDEAHRIVELATAAGRSCAVSRPQPATWAGAC